MSGICEFAIEYTHLHVLQWLLAQGQLTLTEYLSTECNSREIAY